MHLIIYENMDEIHVFMFGIGTKRCVFGIGPGGGYGFLRHLCFEVADFSLRLKRAAE